MKAAMALVVEKTGVRVSSAKGLVWPRSAQPPIRSMTISPSTAKANRAPSSSPSAKLAAKASRTAANRGGQNPRISTSATQQLHPHPGRGEELGREGGDRQLQSLAGRQHRLGDAGDGRPEGVRHRQAFNQGGGEEHGQEIAGPVGRG